MLREIMEKSPIITLAIVFFAGMTICAGAIRGILEFANQDIVPTASYVLKDEVVKQYVAVETYNRIKDQLEIFVAINQEENIRELFALKLGFQGIRKSIIAALEKTCPEGHTCNYVSSAGIKLFNSLARRYNSNFPDQPLFEFPEDTTPNLVTHPQPYEVMSQVELALTLLDGKLEC